MMDLIMLAAVFGAALKCFWHNGITATSARETSCFGEGTEFDGNLLRAFDFINGAGNIVLGNIGGISGIKENDGFIFLSIGNPVF